MAEPEPQSQPESSQATQGPTDRQTLVFMTILSVVCALILAILASALAKPKEEAKELDRSRQMLIAAGLLDYQGRFLMQDDKGKTVPAKYYKEGVVVAGTKEDFATRDQMLAVYRRRLVPFLLEGKNKLKTFEEAGVDFDDYVTSHKKQGYYTLPDKLLYKIVPNPSKEEAERPANPKEAPAIGWVIPVNGFGLWDAIYGYLALEPDANTVRGITWYDQKETPGLGAIISEADWQLLFPGKKVFQPSRDGKTDFKSAPLGITVIKGKVNEMLGDQPKAHSSVDGMAGATLTGNGVTAAYKEVLGAYRPFLYQVHQEWASQESSPPTGS